MRYYLRIAMRAGDDERIINYEWSYNTNSFRENII